MKNSIKILSLAAVSSLMLMSKCGKDRPKVDDETQTIQDNIISEQEFMRIVPTTNDRAIKQKGIGSSGRISSPDPIETKFEVHDGLLGPILGSLGWSVIDSNTSSTFLSSILQTIGGVKYFTPNIDAVKITLEYDDSKKQEDGSTKSGKVITTMLQDNGTAMQLFGEPNGKFTSVLDNYKVGDINYTGSIDVSRISKTIMNMKVNNGTCSKQGAWNSSFNNISGRKITWLRGGNHPTDSTDPSTGIDYLFDEYKIEEAGNDGSEGTSRDGLPYTIKIKTPIIFNTNAKYGITSGIVELKPQDKKPRTIDYSQINSGIVTFTVDGNSFTINL
jgi:hypothetical protein